MGYNVLIVDDSSVMRKIILRNLRQAGIQVDQDFEAADGYEALDALSKNKIHLVLSDINMPNMDGMTFIKELRKNDQLKNVLVIMITTEAGADMVHEAISAGADGYIIKPFTPEQIAKKIESVMV